MFTFVINTEKMQEEGKPYGEAIAWGTKKTLLKWMEEFSNSPETVWCKIVRNKDSKVVSEYRKDRQQSKSL